MEGEWIVLTREKNTRAPWQTATFIEDESAIVIVEFQSGEFELQKDVSRITFGEYVAGPFPTLEAAKVAYKMLAGAHKYG